MNLVKCDCCGEVRRPERMGMVSYKTADEEGWSMRYRDMSTLSDQFNEFTGLDHDLLNLDVCDICAVKMFAEIMRNHGYKVGPGAKSRK